jgi:hypothetical protein
MSESTTIIPAVQIDASSKGWRLFRNSRGVAYMGAAKQVAGGGVYIKNPRRVTFGLTDGASDLIGWRPVVITQEMVGQTIAQFTAVECKTTAYKKLTDAQRDFLRMVQAFGGFAAVARESGGGFDLGEIEPSSSQ